MNLHYAWLEQFSLLEFLVKGFIIGPQPEKIIRPPDFNVW